jgi:hypothetical protein
MVAEFAGRQRRAEPRQERLAVQARCLGVDAGGVVADPSPADDLLRYDRLEADAERLLLGYPTTC